MPVTDIFPGELRHTLPPLQSQEGVPDPVVHARFMTSDLSWIWLVTEGSPQDGDFIFFGYVIGRDQEWGNFSLAELSEARGLLGCRVERDLHFEPARLSRVLAREPLNRLMEE